MPKEMNSYGTCLISCPKQTYVKDAICMKCGEFCLACIDSTNCLYCSSVTLRTYNNTCVMKCPIGTFTNNVDQYCEKCHE